MRVKVNESVLNAVMVQFSARGDGDCSGETITGIRSYFFTVMEQEHLLIYVRRWEETDLNLLREMGAQAAKEVWRHSRYEKQARVMLDCGEITAKFGTAGAARIAEGFLLGSYQFAGFKKSVQPKAGYQAGGKGCGPKLIYDWIGLSQISDDQVLQLQQELIHMENLVEGILFARDMVNMPGNLLRPEHFAGQIAKRAADAGIEVELLDKERITEMGMHALLAVGETSGNGPILVVLRYNGNPGSDRRIAFAGKGVTCDTGGYCLKPADSMGGIKGDMAGGAAVAGAITALAKNQVKVNVTALIPICENRISPDGFLPGDVIKAMDGTYIEVINTDAEGRLILADAISYAVLHEKPEALVDIATLTGAAAKMLGFSIAPVMCQEERLWNNFQKAYRKAGEQYLRLPGGREYQQLIESEIADIKNLGADYAGTITAGLFLKHFAKDVPWLHLDIAGTAWCGKPFFAYHTDGATGSGCASLYYLAQEYACKADQKSIKSEESQEERA